ncbi:MAG: beta-ketoacyl synthase N-terminal-like domain-containing protein, partial [Hydrogeniiclostridium sp.]
MRRVVVTGMGAVTPVGNHLEEYWNSLVEGVCGVDFITRFDVSDKKVKVAAEVKNFDPLEYFEKSELRKNDLFVQYAVAAATQAMNDSKLAGTVEPERLGVYIGSGIGGILTTTESSDKLCQGAKRVSPFMV